MNSCLIRENENRSKMLWGVTLNGKCQGSILKDNYIGKGSEGDIQNRAKGAIVEENNSIGN